MTWCFRQRLDLHDTSKLECPDAEWVIETVEPARRVALGAHDAPSLAEARRVSLVGSGYDSESEAFSSGQFWKAHLMPAFANVRVAADFDAPAIPAGAFV